MKPEDQTIWMTVSDRHGMATIYWDKESALDQLTRSDKLYSCRMVEWKEETV